MNILALDASTNKTSLALKANNDFLTTIEIDSKGASHSESINLNLLELLAKGNLKSVSELDIILLGRGPGSFTGLRIAFAYIKGLAIYHKIKVIPVCSFSSLAYNFFNTNKNSNEVSVILDARRDEFFYANFKRKTLLESEITIKKLEYFLDNKNIISFDDLKLGNNSILKIDKIAEKEIEFFLKYKESLDLEFSYESLALIEPLYIREINAKTIKEREEVLKKSYTNRQICAETGKTKCR